MASRLSSVALALLGVAVVLPCALAGVNMTTLPQTLIVNSAIDGQNVTTDSKSVMVYLTQNLEVSWRLNESFVNQDCNYLSVQIRVCYGAPSFKGRAWRAPNADLSLSKQCQISLAVQPYTSTCTANSTGLLPLQGSFMVPMNFTVWQATRDTPGAMYFVQVMAYNVSSGGTPGNNAVAFGMTSDPTYNNNLFTVVAYSGITVSLDVVVIVLSVVSYALLFGFFFWERYSKKTK